MKNHRQLLTCTILALAVCVMLSCQQASQIDAVGGTDIVERGTMVGNPLAPQQVWASPLPAFESYVSQPVLHFAETPLPDQINTANTDTNQLVRRNLGSVSNTFQEIHDEFALLNLWGQTIGQAMTIAEIGTLSENKQVFELQMPATMPPWVRQMAFAEVQTDTDPNYNRFYFMDQGAHYLGTYVINASLPKGRLVYMSGDFGKMTDVIYDFSQQNTLYLEVNKIFYNEVIQKEISVQVLYRCQDMQCITQYNAIYADAPDRTLIPCVIMSYSAQNPSEICMAIGREPLQSEWTGFVLKPSSDLNENPKREQCQILAVLPFVTEQDLLLRKTDNNTGGTPGAFYSDATTTAGWQTITSQSIDH